MAQESIVRQVWAWLWDAAPLRVPLTRERLAMWCKLTVVLAAGACVACSNESGSVTGPSSVGAPTSQHLTTFEEAPTLAFVEPPAMYVTPALGSCVSYDSLPAVVKWVVHNVLPENNAIIQSAYHFSSTPGCNPTSENRRTQNSHLRTKQVGPLVYVEFDKSAYSCRGRIQPDVDVSGHTVIGLIINNPNGKICGDDVTPPERTPVSPPPSPKTPRPAVPPPVAKVPPYTYPPIIPPPSVCPVDLYYSMSTTPNAGWSKCVNGKQTRKTMYCRKDGANPVCPDPAWFVESRTCGPNGYGPAIPVKAETPGVSIK